MSDSLSVGTLSGRIELEDHITSAMGIIIDRVDQLDSRFGGMGKRVAEGAASFFTAEAALRGLEKVMEIGIDIAKDLEEGLMFGSDVTENFNRLTEAAGHTSSTLLGELRDATHNTIDDMDLMKRVNTDLAAGLNMTDAQFKTLAKGAYALAQATGTDVKTAFDTMSDAMLTGRTRAIAMLTGKIDLAAAEDEYARKLGVSTDKLSADGKMHAAREAILKSVGAATERLGEQTEGLDEKIGQAQVTYTNFMDELGKTISESPVIMAGINGISDALTAAFGGKQEDLIKNIVHWVEDLAIQTLEWAQTVSDAVGIAGRTYNSLKIILESIAQGYRAITYVTEEVLLASAKLINLLSIGTVGDSWIKGLEKDMERLYEEMAKGEARMDGYQKAQDDWAVTTGHVNDALEGVRQKMLAAQKAQDEQALSANGLEKAEKGVTQQTQDLAIAQDRAGDVLAQTSEEAKKQRDAWTELHSIGKSYEETVKGISAANLASIKSYLDAGAAQGALAAAYGVTAAQVKAIAEEMKLQQKILDDQSGRWADYNKLVAEMSGDTEKVLRADIEKWKDAQIKAHKEAKTDTEDFYQWVEKMSKAMYDKEDQRRLESDQNSKAHFDKIAREAQEAYDFALKHSDQFTEGHIKDLAKASEAARNAATNWKASIGGAIDQTTEKVRTLSGEMITLEEKAKRMASGGSYTISRANLAENLKTWGVPETLGFTLAEKGFSFQEILDAWRSKTYDKWKPQGPRIPGFRDGGIGDFGEGTLAVLHGKEAIVPLDSNHNLGVTNVFYVNGTAEETARKIGSILMRDLKSNRQFSNTI